HRSTDHTTVRGDSEEFVVRTYYHSADQSAAPLRDLSGNHALSAAPLNGIFLDRRALGVTSVSCDKYIHTVANHFHRQQFIVFGEAHPDHSGCRPAHGTERLVVGVEPDGLCLLAHQQQVVPWADERSTDELVVVLEVDRNDAAAAVGVELRQCRLLDKALLGREDEIRRHVVVRDLDHLSDVLVRLERQQVGYVLAPRYPVRLGKLVRLRAVYPALVSEEQDPVVR